MLILLFLVAALNLSTFGAPVTTLVDAFDPLPALSILGRDIPIPECVDPARHRSMRQIVLSCLTTIFACTWVSLHSNVPDPRNSAWQNLAMRLKMMFWALIGPEFITIWAFRQRKAAAAHAKAYNEKFEREFCGLIRMGVFSNFLVTLQPWSTLQCIKDWFCRPKGYRMPDRAWTLTHGFLLEMHGLVFVKDGQPLVRPPITRDEESKLLQQYRALLRDGSITEAEQIKRKLFIEGSRPSLPPGILYDLSQLSNCFDISEDEINDKCDLLTKLIVVVQTSWFIIQCIARWVQRLHVTELEIVTLAFGVLNIITYSLWWNKPQDMCLAIPISVERRGGCEVVVEKDKVDGGNVSSDSPSCNEHALPGGQCRSAAGQALLSNEEKSSHSHHTSRLLSVPSFLSRLGPMLGHTILGLPHACLMFIKAINPFPAYSQMIGDDNISDNIRQTSDTRIAFYSSAGGTEDGTVALAIVLIGVLFGAVHLLPIWLSSFSSTPAKWLWISSTVYVAVEPVLVSLVVPVCLWLVDNGIVSMNRGGALDLITDLPHTIGFILYAVARVILIVLAFTSLRSLPSNAFDTVEWSTFFPHI